MITNNTLIISHRTNTCGQWKDLENHPNQVKKVIYDLQMHCEIDVWLVKGQFYLGHDFPQYKVTQEFLMHERLWLHCKNLEALIILRELHPHVFSHDKDQFGLTNYGSIITCDWNNCKNCILVCSNPRFKKLPKDICGIITDYPVYYQKIL